MSQTQTTSVLLLLLTTTAAAGGCALADHPQNPAAISAPSAQTWDEVFARPAVIEHEAVISGTWHVPLSGLLNLEHPAAKAAGLVDREVDIVLPVHVLKHPQHGTFIIDTGATQKVHAQGLVTSYLADLKTLEPVADIIARSGGKLAGVLLTHFHLDHVMGLPEIDPTVPVMLGPGELEVSEPMNALTRSTYDAFLQGRDPLRTFRFDQGQTMGPIERAIDVLGDGSIWALHMPGHTAGSTAYVVHTTAGPKLFAGDTSHTWWGWTHGVEPGEYTADHAQNRRSLAALKKLKEQYPDLEVFVGHELDGVGTGIGR